MRQALWIWCLKFPHPGVESCTEFVRRWGNDDRKWKLSASDPKYREAKADLSLIVERGFLDHSREECRRIQNLVGLIGSG